MLKKFKKNIVKLGLAGLLSFGIAGCATPIGCRYETKTIEDIWAFDEEKIVTREEKKGSALSYQISDIKNVKQNLNFSVKESKKEISDIITQTIIPIYKEEQQIKQNYEVYFTIVGPSDEFRGSSEVLSRDRVKVRDNISEEKKTKEKVIFADQPAKDLLVKVSSDYFGFGGNKDSSFLTKTDTNGIAKVQITKKPFLWYFDEDEAVPYVAAILKKGMRKNLLDKINFKSVPSRNKSKEYPLTIKTMSEANLAINFEENLKFIDDKKTFYVAGTEIDISPLYSSIEEIIKTELESRYMPRKAFIKAVGEDLCPVDANIEFKKIKTLSLEEISNEAEKIKANYLVKGEELFENVNVNPSYLISDLDGKSAEITQEGLEFSVNVPSEYEITVKREGYKPAKGKLKFTEKARLEYEVEMSKLSTSVSIGGNESRITPK